MKTKQKKLIRNSIIGVFLIGIIIAIFYFSISQSAITIGGFSYSENKTIDLGGVLVYGETSRFGTTKGGDTIYNPFLNTCIEQYIIDDYASLILLIKNDCRKNSFISQYLNEKIIKYIEFDFENASSEIIKLHDNIAYGKYNYNNYDNLTELSKTLLDILES